MVVEQDPHLQEVEVRSKRGNDGVGGGGVDLGVEEEDLLEVFAEARGGDPSPGDKPEEEEDDATVLSRLEALCGVLGSKYQEKLDEVGLVSGLQITKEVRTKLSGVVSFLETVKLDRFKEINRSGKKLLDAWSKSEQPIERLLRVHQLLHIMKAESADEINEEKYLSATLLRTIEKETKNIESADLALLKEKYQRNKKKLLQLMRDLRLAPSDVGFDPKQKIAAADYPESIKMLKQLIKELRKERLPRMPLVFNMEMIAAAQKKKFSTEKLKGLIEETRATLEETLDEGEVCMYNGRDVLEILHDAEEEVAPKQAEQADSSGNNQTARSVRLSTRLKKKDIPVRTVQEAAVCSLKIQKKCRSGMEKRHVEVPVSKEGADLPMSKAQTDLTGAAGDASKQ